MESRTWLRTASLIASVISLSAFVSVPGAQALETNSQATAAANYSERLQKNALRYAEAAYQKAVDLSRRAKQAIASGATSRGAELNRQAAEQRQEAERFTQLANLARAASQHSDEAVRVSQIKAIAARNEAEHQRAVAYRASIVAKQSQIRAEISAAEEKAARTVAEEALEKWQDTNALRIRRLKDFINDHPTDTVLPEELARLYLDRQDYPHAQEAFSELIRRKPDEYSAYAERGSCFRIDARNRINELVNRNLSPETSPAEYQVAYQGFQNAIQDFTTFLNHVTVTPNNSTMVGSAYAGRAEAYRNLRSYAAALRDLTAQEKIGSPPVDEIERGRDLLALQKYDQAVEAFTQVLVKRDTHSQNALMNAADGYFWIGVTRQQQGEYDAAYTAFGRYQEFHPNYERIYENRVQCLLAAKRWPDVLKECHRYHQVFPQTAKMYPWQAYAYLNLGDLKGYQALCNEGMARYGNGTPENANFAAWTCALGPDGLPDYSNALQIASRAVEAAEKQVGNGTKDEVAMGALWANRNTLAALLYRAGRYSEAIHELEACETMPRTFQPDDRFGDYILLALTNARAKNLPAAKAWLQKAKATVATPGVEQQIFLHEAEGLVK